MRWIDLLDNPLQVACHYPEGPSLSRFALMDLILHGNSAEIRGDLASLPEPLPKRWSERGYTRAQCKVRAGTLRESRVEGAPRLGLDERYCLLGDPVDLRIEQGEGFWESPDGTRRPMILLTGRSNFLTFTFLCENLSLTIEGYEPAPY